MINNIQFLRAFAALSVVVYHTDFEFRNGIHTEFHAVPIFFVISGFIMTFISRNNPTGFFYNRCVRIIPLYALLTLTLFSWKLKALFPSEILHYLANNEGGATGLTLETLLKSLFFIPYVNAAKLWEPINAVGWTLNLEMYFYVLYSVTLLISARFAPLMVGVVIFFIHVLGGVCTTGMCTFYAQDVTIYFVLGIVAYYLWQAMESWMERRNKVVVIWLTVVGALLFFAWHLSGELVTSFGWFPIAAINYLLPFLVVITALFLHTMQIRCNWKFILVLGEASYALYLIHIFVIGQLRALGYYIGPQVGIGMMTIVVVASCVLAIILHYRVERPITYYLRFKRVKQA